MATTSPDNLRTPDPGAPYQLTTDLATFANDIQDALTRRANAFTGTAAERAAFTGAITGSLWQDTDGIGMIWKWSGSTWIPAIWQWSGTNVQMTAFAPPDGFIWFNTTNNVEFVRIAGVWRPTRLSGTVSVGTVNNTVTAGPFTINFSPAFPTAPRLLISSNSVRVGPGYNPPTASSADLYVGNFSGANETGIVLYWQAFL